MSGDTKPDLIWAYLLHLGYNMWHEKDAPPTLEYVNASDSLRFDKELWNDVLNRLAAAGGNTVVIDLGEGVRYESHPELAVSGSWSVGQLRDELARMRAMGLQPIPKLNFSTAHDEWLGDYARCVSSRRYYEVCRDLIHEVIAIFDKPQYFHLGMDEETFAHQRNNLYALVRQGDLWWHDLFFLIDQVEKDGVRPWVWSDMIWNHEAEFLRQMPRSVLQSNWYYGGFQAVGPDAERYIRAYDTLEAHGYDQVPTGSNWSRPDNFPETVAYAREHIAPERLFGFLQTVWKPTLQERCYRHYEAIDLISQSR
ncbi:MAG: Tat pathway signal protein [Bacillota bacterium]|nr:Tat pathway signal protein [Bacillota bacterium]